MEHKAKQWFKPLARIGYASRGLIYLVIGYFAALAAIGAGQPMGSREALGKLLTSGAGAIMAYGLIAALIFYAVWRLIQSGFDTDDHGFDPKGLAIRGGLAASGIIYLTLAFYVWSLRSAAGDSGGGGGFAETLAGFVGSRWASTTLALVLAGVAVAHVAKALRGKYAGHMDASGHAMTIIHPIAKTGLVARGMVFLVVAFLFALRAVRADGSGKPPDSQQALEFIQSLPAGWALLAAIGFGLVAFALYSLIEAIYRRINIEDA